MSIRVIFLAGLFYVVPCEGQDKLRLGLATNLAKLAYNAAEMDILLSDKNERFSGLFGLMYTNGKIYQGNKSAIDPVYMQDKPNRVFGWGADLQVRYKIIPMKHAELGIYLALGASFNRYRLTFYENQYIYHPSNAMYYYGLATYHTSFYQTAIYTQVFFSANIFKRIHTEIGGGVAYNKPDTSELLDTYRDFNRDVWDYAVKGLSPVFTCRIGYWLYR